MIRSARFARFGLLTLLTLVAQAACGEGGATIAVVLDLPSPTSNAYPFGAQGVDSIRLAVARAGDESDLLSSKELVSDGVDLDAIPFGRDLVLHLFGEQNGVEVAYGRSCTFDFEDAASGPESIHVFFSRVVRWGEGPQPLITARVGGHTFQRANGSLVIAGGEAPMDLELFNPRTGEISVLEEAPSTIARSGSRFALLGDDRAVIIGGTDEVGRPVVRLEVLHDLRDSLEMGLGAREHASASLVSGRTLVAGGGQWDGTKFVTSPLAWEIATGDGGALNAPLATGALEVARKRHTLTRLSDEVGAPVIAIGGLDSSDGPVATAEVYRPLARVFETVSGTLARWDHSAIRLPGGAVLIIGGFRPGAIMGSQEAARDLILFDPIGGSFTVAGTLPPTAPLTDFSLTPLPDGRVLLAGGRDEGGAASSQALIVRFDVINGLVDMVSTDSLRVPHAGHAATLLCDGTVLVTGGTTDAGPSERYNPPPDNRR